MKDIYHCKNCQKEYVFNRIQLDFTPEAYQRLEKVKGLSGLRSGAEVLSNALRLYEWYLNKKKSNAKFQIVVEDGLVKEVELFF